MAFTRRCTITPLTGKVPSALSNYPVLITTTHNDLKLIANGGYVANSNGYDIRLFADEPLTSARAYQLIAYDGTAGTVLMWGNIGTMDVGVPYYLGFGDAALNTDGSSSSVWDSFYKGVWHFDGASLSMVDATSNANHGSGVSSPTAATGKIGHGVETDGTSYVSVPDQSYWDPAAAFTISLWMKYDDLAGQWYEHSHIAHDPTGFNNKWIFARVADGSSTWRWHTNNPGEGANIELNSSTTTTAAGTWYFVGITRSGTTFTFYLQGATNGTASNGNTIAGNAAALFIGNGEGGAGNRFDGVQDEVRFSDGIARSTAWFTTDYNSQNDPSTFASYDFEEVVIPDAEIAAHFSAGAGFSASAYVSRIRGARWLAIGSIALDDAPEYLATGRTTHPTRTYEGRVLSWGNIDKSIPVPSGMPQASVLRCRIADTDNVWRDKLGGQTPQGRRVQVKFLQEGTSEAAADILFTGVIEEFSTGPGYVEVYAVSDELTWMDEQIPDVITPENFPEYAKVETAFLPVWLGHVVGKAVSLGFAKDAPEEPAAGALVDAADAADALTAQILAAVFSGGLLGVLTAEQQWIDKIESKYAQGLALIINEFNFQYDAGVIELADAVYAQAKLQDLLDATDARATEYEGLNSSAALVIASFRGGVTSFFGTDWANMLAEIDGKIATLEGSPAEEQFAPQGAVPLPYIGGNTRWGAAMHPLWQELALYRKEPDEAVFTPVEIAEYTVTLEARTFAEYPGTSFTCTFIDFVAPQPDGTEIRLDADGAYARAEFGAMPAVGYPADPDWRGPLRNPVDAFLIMKELILPKSATAEFTNIDALIALRNKYETGGATVPPLFCDGVVNESMTGRELMGRFTATFQSDFFPDNRGREKQTRIDDTDPNRPVITDHVILRNAWSEKSPNPTVNRYRANYSHDYATGKWFDIALADNLADQTNRGKVQDGTVDFWFARDAQTALASTQDRLRYTALGSYRQRFQVPLTEVSSFLQLARLVGITHPRGMRVSGYIDREVKINGYSIDLDNFKVEIDSVVRAPVPFGQRQLAEANFSAGAVMTVENSGIYGGEIWPTAYTVSPDVVLGPFNRGLWTERGDAIDKNSSTATRFRYDGGGALHDPNLYHVHTWESFDTTGLVSVDIYVDMEFFHNTSTAATDFWAELKDGISNNPNIAGAAIVGFTGNADIARGIQSANLSAATWLGQSNPVVRCGGYTTAGGHPEIDWYIYGIWLIPRYS